MTNTTNSLASGEALHLGDKLVSPNGRYQLRLQAHDGNLVLYQQLPSGQERATWSTGTHKPAHDGDFVQQAIMQKDGNFVLYTHAQEHTNPRWSSKTNSDANSGAALRLQNDGNLVMYLGDRAVWSSDTWSHAHWMEELDENLPLQNICVPGSHDAGMYLPDIPIIKEIALTQSQTLYGQLHQGSRYFDLRPCYSKDRGFHVYHGPIDGPSLEQILHDVRQFFDEGSRETIILEFTHWKNFDGQDGAFVDLLLQQLPAQYLLQRSELPSVATGQPLDLATMSLRQLRGKIIVLIDNETMYREAVQKLGKEGIYLKNEYLPIYDSYSNKQSYDDMLRDQTDKFRTFGDTRGLFMLNWTLTSPAPEDYEVDGIKNIPLIGKFLDKGQANARAVQSVRSVENDAKAINPRLREAAQSQHLLSKRNGTAAKRMVNIINLDYVHTANAVQVCRQLIHDNNPLPA